ncbi:methylhydantoinase [Falsiroseomonas bella]|uniref:Methylhydantoinase n=1 Tax=Falsiroseomonas bella TaxID=2184016 RepID=A0A317FJC3_9PROT|nr:hydantoinase/oxoprolinase family protein [Falsiroseomonas bella]PWS38723.1 methylhydantoinase [Falsiroseomonas bella]
MSAGPRLGIDIGGTFTDFVLVEEGSVLAAKVLTTPHAPEEAVFRGIAALEAERPGFAAEAAGVIHATTLVTNAILTRRGARTGLIATAGFRDVIEMRREVRYDLFDMFIRYPAPLVPRELRLGVRERVLADGSVLEPLQEGDVREAARRFREANVDAVAVCLLHAYANPAHERRIAEILREELPDAELSLSHEVHPEPKEYERSSTTVVDAYVKRLTATYLDRLQHGLRQRGYARPLFMMLSNGGTATADIAKRFPVQIVESGPAAGVEAAIYFGGRLGLSSLLAFDMGGTTAKLCLVEEGRAARTRHFEVDRVHRFKAGSGMPVAVPVYDLLEIGAGGGSIARVDDLGLIRVGPESAGSDPAPACYGLGGVAPTVTDADLALGYLNPDFFLGGDMKLDRARAEAAIAARVAEPAGLDTARAAAGIHAIVNETMAAAGRVYVADKGKSPAALALVVTGGAGPVHAVGLARRLGCRRVVVPPLAGVMSSLGLLAAPIAFERSRPVNRRLAGLDVAAVAQELEALAAEAVALLPPDATPEVRRSADLRYHGQDHALEIPIGGALDATLPEQLAAGFVAAYEALYGKVDDDNPIEIAALRVEARQPQPPPALPAPRAGKPGAPVTTRPAWQHDAARFEETPVYRRETLALHQEIVGPAIVEERESTTVIGPGDILRVHDSGALIIDLATPDREG